MSVAFGIPERIVGDGVTIRVACREQVGSRKGLVVGCRRARLRWRHYGRMTRNNRGGRRRPSAPQRSIKCLGVEMVAKIYAGHITRLRQLRGVNDNRRIGTLRDPVDGPVTV